MGAGSNGERLAWGSMSSREAPGLILMTTTLRQQMGPFLSDSLGVDSWKISLPFLRPLDHANPRISLGPGGVGGIGQLTVVTFG